MSSAPVFVNHTRDSDTKGTDRFISTRVSSAEGLLPTNWTSFREKSDRQMLASDPTLIAHSKLQITALRKHECN